MNLSTSSSTRKPNPGHFKKGPDSRRHKLTQEEIERGYENAKLSVDARFPDARCPHNAALSHCMLRVLQPGSYERVISERKAAHGRRAA